MLQCSHSVGIRSTGYQPFSELVPRFSLEYFMRNINITAITALTTTALKAGDELFGSCTGLQAEFKGCDKAQVHSTLLPMVVAYYAKKGADLTFTVQGSGRMVMQGEASDVSKATKRLNKLVAVITATVQDKVELDVPADILAAAAKLWALCAKHEKLANRLCATAIATVKAK